MRKLLRRRPSAGAVIGFIALCVALGGGAYAATSKKVEYKGLSKDARLKVLPIGATNAGTDCDPSQPDGLQDLHLGQHERLNGVPTPDRSGVQRNLQLRRRSQGPR